MKTAKLISSIISIVLFIFICYQSCAASLLEAFGDGGTSGSAGYIVAFLMLIAGIVGVCTRESKGGGIFTGIMYAIAALIGFSNSGVYTDLNIWSGLCLIFTFIFIIGGFTLPQKTMLYNNNPRRNASSGEHPVNTIVCPQCKAIFHNGAHICMNCGYEFRSANSEQNTVSGTKQCPSCNNIISSKDKFFPICGARQ